MTKRCSPRCCPNGEACGKDLSNKTEVTCQASWVLSWNGGDLGLPLKHPLGIPGLSRGSLLEKKEEREKPPTSVADFFLVSRPERKNDGCRVWRVNLWFLKFS